MDGGMRDRASCGKRVCGGAGRRGDNQPVATKPGDQPSIYHDLKFNHARQHPFSNDDIVEHRAVRDVLSMAVDSRPHHHALLEIKFVREYALQCGVQLIDCRLGQESQSTHVDAKDRHSLLFHQSCSVEHRPITA